MHTTLQTTETRNMLSDMRRDVLFEIILGLKQMRISKQKAQQIAKAFVTASDAKTKKELIDALSEIAKTYEEIKSVFLKYAVAYDTERRTIHVQLMVQYVHMGDIESALQIAKGGMIYE